MKYKSFILMLTVIAGIFLFPGFRFRKPVPKESMGIIISQETYADGKYKGIATGFRPGLEVEISIKNGKLLKVEILDHNEIGPQYWMRAFSTIPKAIVDKQTTGVDAIGGATFTSNGIKAAVENALSKAIKQ